MIELVDERHVMVNNVLYDIEFTQVGDQPVYSLLVDGRSFDIHLYQDEDTWHVIAQGDHFAARVEDEREKHLRSSFGDAAVGQGEYHLKAPMPGLVVSVPVAVGQKVDKGDILLVLESMKMQNELRSPQAGIVTRVRVSQGDRVEKKDTLINVGTQI